jgi:hypothetical protein
MAHERDIDDRVEYGSQCPLPLFCHSPSSNGSVHERRNGDERSEFCELREIAETVSARIVNAHLTGVHLGSQNALNESEIHHFDLLMQPNVHFDFVMILPPPTNPACKKNFLLLLGRAPFRQDGYVHAYDRAELIEVVHVEKAPVVCKAIPGGSRCRAGLDSAIAFIAFVQPDDQQNEIRPWSLAREPTIGSHEDDCCFSILSLIACPLASVCSFISL